MNIIVVKNQQEGGVKGFEVFKDVYDNGGRVFGLATGSTPLSIYQELRNSDLDFSQKTSINLDEYLGLSGDHDQSYRYFMNQNLFGAKPFLESFVPNGGAADPLAETKHYDDVIAAHPIDIQLLGIGQNGHIGFNEPGTPFESTTHIVDLQESTIKANARFFENESDVPKQAISMGIASIMSAKQILLVAYGESKAEAIYQTVKGQISEEVPATVLQNHDNVTIIVDEAAASKL